MSTAPNLYDVTLTTATEGPQAAEALLTAFGTHGPSLAGTQAMSVESGENYVTVRFAGVSDDPSHGLTSTEQGPPGAEIVAALAGFSHERLLTVALLKALLTFSAMREAAGLPPRDRLRIDVMPASRLAQDAVSQRLSEGAANEFPAFQTTDPD